MSNVFRSIISVVFHVTMYVSSHYIMQQTLCPTVSRKQAWIQAYTSTANVWKIQLVDRANCSLEYHLSM